MFIFSRYCQLVGLTNLYFHQQCFWECQLFHVLANINTVILFKFSHSSDIISQKPWCVIVRKVWLTEKRTTQGEHCPTSHEKCEASMQQPGFASPVHLCLCELETAHTWGRRNGSALILLLLPHSTGDWTRSVLVNDNSTGSRIT